MKTQLYFRDAAPALAVGLPWNEAGMTLSIDPKLPIHVANSFLFIGWNLNPGKSFLLLSLLLLLLVLLLLLYV